MKLTIINKTGGNFRIPGTDDFLMFAMEKVGRENRVKIVELEGEKAEVAKKGIEKMMLNGSVKKWIENGLLEVKVDGMPMNYTEKRTPGRPPKQ